MVQEVVGEPSGLLVEQAHDASSHGIGQHAAEVVADGHRQHPDRKGADDLPRVVDQAGVIQTKTLDLDAKLTVGRDEVLGALLLGDILLAQRLTVGIARGLVHVADVELLEQLEGRSRVEDGESVRGVLACLCEHDSATRVALPLADVVDLVVDHNPGRGRRGVLRQLGIRDEALGLRLLVHHGDCRPQILECKICAG